MSLNPPRFYAMSAILGRWGWNAKCKQIFVSCACLILFAGCRAASLVQDQTDLRHALIGVYQDQVLDNLIRTSLSLPTVSVAYNTATGTVTDTAEASLTGGPVQTLTHSSTPSRVLQWTLSGNGHGQRQSQLTLTGTPIFDQDISNAYSRYLATRGEVGLTTMKPDKIFLSHIFQTTDGKDVTYYISDDPDNRSEFQILYNKVTQTAFHLNGAAKGALNELLTEQTLARLNSQRF